ncbi:MAG: response regulator transcription factor [Clostridia bacterium]|nr:response regulator transcription factor [Clostridia bacterium]MBQ4623716.1 response regulator transcription factor [Clostridia bacterium]MBR6764542.1 response regulator transcription factor [Clostridia bacterium]
MTKKMLIAEDDSNIAVLLRLYMEKEGYEVTIAADGGEALRLYRTVRPHIILLDVMMPVADGWQVCNEIRKDSDVPIIMLTARGETSDKVSGLDSGADDYIVKPFEMREVIARVNAVMRRTLSAESVNTHSVSFDNLFINLDNYQLYLRGKLVDVPPKEIELLYFLASNPHKVFTREQLLDHVWGFEYTGDTRTVDVHIKRLREKLDGVSNRWMLKTVWGVGYKFELVNL